MSGLVKGCLVVVLDLVQCGDAVNAGISVGDNLVVYRVRDGGCDYYANGELFYLQNRRIRLSYPNPPHKHAELIKAWADGAEIQFGDSQDEWLDVLIPSWDTFVKYRIKPAKSTKDIKLEELEAKALELAKEIKELRDV